MEIITIITLIILIINIIFQIILFRILINGICDFKDKLFKIIEEKFTNVNNHLSNSHNIIIDKIQTTYKEINDHISKIYNNIINNANDNRDALHKLITYYNSETKITKSTRKKTINKDKEINK